MRSLWLWVGVLILIVNGPVWASSYQLNDGTVVNSISSLSTPNSHVPYTGVDLKPGVDLSGLISTQQNFRARNLWWADLSNADLANANFALANGGSFNFMDSSFQNANLSNANFSNADLSSTIFVNANISGTNFTNANIKDADFTNVQNWQGATWTGAHYTLNYRACFDNSIFKPGAFPSTEDGVCDPLTSTKFPEGMDRAWRDAHGMVALSGTIKVTFANGNFVARTASGEVVPFRSNSTTPVSKQSSRSGAGVAPSTHSHKFKARFSLVATDLDSGDGLSLRFSDGSGFVEEIDFEPSECRTRGHNTKIYCRTSDRMARIRLRRDPEVDVLYTGRILVKHDPALEEMTEPWTVQLSHGDTHHVGQARDCEKKNSGKTLSCEW